MFKWFKRARSAAGRGWRALRGAPPKTTVASGGATPAGTAAGTGGSPIINTLKTGGAILGVAIVADGVGSLVTGEKMISANLYEIASDRTSRWNSNTSAGEIRSKALERGAQAEPVIVERPEPNWNVEVRQDFATSVEVDSSDLLQGLNSQAAALGIEQFSDSQIAQIKSAFKTAVETAGDPVDNPSVFFDSFVSASESRLNGMGLSEGQFNLLDRYMLDGNANAPQADNSWLKRARGELNEFKATLGR